MRQRFARQWWLTRLEASLCVGFALLACRLPHRWLLRQLVLEFSTIAPSLEPDVTGAVSTYAFVTSLARRLPFEMTCLQRSLALMPMLRRRHIAAELRIGVRRADTRLEAHAWVEVDGTPVNDTPAHTASFATVPNIPEAAPMALRASTSL